MSSSPLRRGFLARCASLSIAPGLLFAQPAKTWNLAWLSPANGPGPNHQAFLQALKKLGYEEGRNLRIDWAWVGQSEQLPQAAVRLVQGNPDVLICQSHAGALAGQKATSTIPIVFVGVREPVKAGLVASMARPGGNITGMTLTPNAELAAKHIELLKELAPKASRLAVFWNPQAKAQAEVVETIKSIGQTQGLLVRPFEVHLAGDIERAFVTIARERYDGLLTLVEWFTLSQRALIAKLAIENRIATLFEVKDYVKAGGLLSYGVVYHDHYAQAATYIDKILRGAKPSDLPVLQPASLELAINLGTAKAIGLAISPGMAMRANELIE